MELARILIYGDIHLNSKNYGGHIDYAKESLDCFKQITAKAEETKATHIIGLGDLTYNRFHTLEYRKSVEGELRKQYELTSGNRYELKGNHDSAGYGMTEYEYYIEKGLIKPSTNLSIGQLNISMVDNGLIGKTKIIEPSEGTINIVLSHDFLKFKDTPLPDYGKAIYIEDIPQWYGTDYIICGHIHGYELFKGYMVKGLESKTVLVQYLGCLSRPQFRAGHMDEQGHVTLLTISDNGDLKYDTLDIPLKPLPEIFNLNPETEDLVTKKDKGQRVDISDIVHQLNSHTRSVGNPEEIIANLMNVDQRYKKKAIELLKEGQSAQ